MHSYVMALMVVGASAVAVSGQAPAAPAKPMASVPAHILLTPGDIKWGPAEALPGAQMACTRWGSVQAGLLHAAAEVP